MTDESPRSGRFQTTRWTQVLAARGSTPDGRQALRDLCETYYAPVELFVRRGHGPDQARDLTHEFFAKLLEGNSLETLDRKRGRFRSYLLGAVKHFLSDLRDRNHAARRGGGRVTQSLDQSQSPSESESQNREISHLADPDGFPPDAFFDRQWALAVVERAIETLREEAIAAGEVGRFDALKPCLVVSNTSEENAQIAALGLSSGGLKVAIHRLRKRFRQVVRSRIADTVGDPEEVSAELDYLISALAFSTTESA